jgi:hypothetical protein
MGYVDVVDQTNSSNLPGPFKFSQLGRVTTLNLLSGGLLPHQRIGDEVRLKYLEIRGIFENTLNLRTSLSAQYCRYAIVYDSSPNGTLPTFAEIFKSSVNSLAYSQVTNHLSLQNIDTMARFTILFEKSLTLPTMGSFGQSEQYGRIELTRDQLIGETEEIETIPDWKMTTTGTMEFIPRQMNLADVVTVESTTIDIEADMSPVSAATDGILTTTGASAIAFPAGSITWPLPIPTADSMGPGSIGIFGTTLITSAQGGTDTITSRNTTGTRNTNFNGSASVTGQLNFKFAGEDPTIYAPYNLPEEHTEFNAAKDEIITESFIKGFMDVDLTSKQGIYAPIEGTNSYNTVPSYAHCNTGIITSTTSDLFIDERIQLKNLPTIYQKDKILQPPFPDLPVDLSSIATGALYLVTVGNLQNNTEPWHLSATIRLTFEDV